MKSTTKANFDQDVIKSSKLVLLDVWAPWCGPCRGMEPIIEAISNEAKDFAEVIKLDASVEMDQVQELSVSALPTFLIFKDGKVVDSSVGATSKMNLLDLLSKHK